MPFDLISDAADIVIAIDVVGAPVEGGRKRLTGIDLMFGATQLMMQSIIAMKLKHMRSRQCSCARRSPASGCSIS